MKSQVESGRGDAEGDSPPGRRVVLNVGGGSKAIPLPPYFGDWEHLLLDIDPRGGADLVCDARKLREGFPANAYDAIYCSHNLEHYYRHEAVKVLAGFLHVLKQEGFAEIRVPDIGALVRVLAENDLDIDAEMYVSPAGPISAHDIVYGYGREIEATGQDFYAHKTGFTRQSLLRTLVDSGFSEVYFVQPVGLLELRVFAFKSPAERGQRDELGLAQAGL